jgi:membrane carboxypeptidase/penicillin-binding protein
MAKEDSSGKPISMSGTGGLRTVTGGSFPAAIWTAFMRDALKNEPIMEFAPPPGDALTPIDCPDFIEADLDDIPAGCPVPEVLNEFGPEGQGSGADPFESESTLPDPANQDPANRDPDNEFGPDPNSGLEDPTIGEAIP